MKPQTPVSLGRSSKPDVLQRPLEKAKQPAATTVSRGDRNAGIELGAQVESSLPKAAGSPGWTSPNSSPRASNETRIRGQSQVWPLEAPGLQSAHSDLAGGSFQVHVPSPQGVYQEQVQHVPNQAPSGADGGTENRPTSSTAKTSEAAASENVGDLLLRLLDEKASLETLGSELKGTQLESVLNKRAALIAEDPQKASYVVRKALIDSLLPLGLISSAKGLPALEMLKREYGNGYAPPVPERAKFSIPEGAVGNLPEPERLLRFRESMARIVDTVLARGEKPIRSEYLNPLTPDSPSIQAPGGIALVVVDMQLGGVNIALGSNRPPDEIATLALRQIELVQALQEHGVPAVIVRTANFGETIAQIKKQIVGHLPWIEVEKIRATGFHETQSQLTAHQALQKMGAKTIIVIGVNRSACALATAKDGLELGYEVIGSDELLSDWQRSGQEEENLYPQNAEARQFFEKHGGFSRTTAQLVDLIHHRIKGTH
jgi:nicotinamidase-related amidase